MIRKRSWSVMVIVVTIGFSLGAVATSPWESEMVSLANRAQSSLRPAMSVARSPIEIPSVPPGMKRVVERKSKVIHYTVVTPVREVREKQVRYTVNKPVFETREKVLSYTVSHPVEETRQKRVSYRICRMVPEVKTKTVSYTVSRMERETRTKTVEYDEIRFVPVESNETPT